MLRRRKFTRYNTFDNVIPPLNTPTPSQQYPQFVPEISSFQYDNFMRAAHSYSTVDFQMFTNSINYSPDHYRKAIFQGIDLFEELSDEFDWIDDEDLEDDLIDLIKPFKRTFADYYGYNESSGELDSFIILYTPYRIWAEFTRALGSVYYYITGEQVHNAIFIYYYFYYYFLFTEYIYEHLCLYFPAFRVASEYQLFSTFEGTYFNFYEIVLGCYLPIIFIFYFSQYHFFRSLFNSRSSFIFGNSILLYCFIILPVYVLVGYSKIFIFFTFCIFFCIFSAFYIFEFRTNYSSINNFNTGYFSYFLPAPSNAQRLLCLPIFYFHYKNWQAKQTLNYNSKKPFTRFPFVINVQKIVLHKSRIDKFRLLELTYRKGLTFATPPSMPIMGLTFPKTSNIHAYSFKSHKNYIIRYPTKEFIPYSESQDHEYYNEIDQEEWPLHIRDFMNHPGGFSNISFLEFISKQKSFRSVDYQFSYFSDEERDFYDSIPSRKFVEFLYPYAALKFWLSSINGGKQTLMSDKLFKFKVFELNSVSVSKPELHVIPYWLRRTIDVFFIQFSAFLDFFTFYSFFDFSIPSSTADLSIKLAKINQVLVKDRKVSYKFYKYMAIFFFRSLSSLRRLNNKKKDDQSYYFTFLSLLRQFEEIFFNLNQKQANYRDGSLCFKYISLCLRILKKKIDGFEKLVV